MLNFLNSESGSVVVSLSSALFGLSRVSTGPPIRVRLAGTQLDPRASMIATATMAGGAAWQVATRWVFGPIVSMNWIR